MMAAHHPLRHGGEGHHSLSHSVDLHDFRPSTSLTYDDHATSTPSIATTLPLPPLSNVKSVSSSAPPPSLYSAFSERHPLSDAAALRWPSLHDSAPPSFSSSSSSLLLSHPSSSAPLQGEEVSGGGAGGGRLHSRSPSFSLPSTLTDALASQSLASSPSPYSSLSPSPPSTSQSSSSSPMPRISAVTPPTSHSFSQSHHPFLHTNPLSLTLPSSLPCLSLIHLLLPVPRRPAHLLATPHLRRAHRRLRQRRR